MKSHLSLTIANDPKTFVTKSSFSCPQMDMKYVRDHLFLMANAVAIWDALQHQHQLLMYFTMSPPPPSLQNVTKLGFFCVTFFACFLFGGNSYFIRLAENRTD
ncbi:hypothetical protein CEXT_767901 [Caerostris extrusa]|uniref:Transmembrane protein n=1 Tax=Caerostris extrusa TaxID=172846 RepID=A0AAV4UK43_CAEEX|nr:hypothetical protein CEXT_767901 [Caerostris extrusa]